VDSALIGVQGAIEEPDASADMAAIGAEVSNCRLAVQGSRRTCAKIPINEDCNFLADSVCGTSVFRAKTPGPDRSGGSGPGGSNQMAMLSLLQAPQVEVLGTGNAWRDAALSEDVCRVDVALINGDATLLNAKVSSVLLRN
jgi:hypothetical protein